MDSRTQMQIEGPGVIPVSVSRIAGRRRPLRRELVVSRQHLEARLDVMIRQACRAGSKVVGVHDGAQHEVPAVPVTAPYGCLLGTQALQLETGGATHLLAKPYDGVTPMAGEHHTWLPGSLRGPVTFSQDDDVFWWDAGDDWELASLLSDCRELSDMMLAIAHIWAPEHRGFEFDWRIQLRPMGGGQTHIAMVAPREDPVALDAGFEEFTEVCGAVAPLLDSRLDAPEQYFLQPTGFASLFERMLVGAVEFG